MRSDEATVRAKLLEVLRQRSAEIADRWVALQSRREVVDGGLAEADLREESDALVGALADSLSLQVPAERIVREHRGLADAVTEMSLRRARAGGAPTATSLAILSLKEVLLEAVQEEGLQTREMFATTLTVNRLLDSAGALVFETYVEGREEIIRRQSRQLLEVSTPVVRLWRHVLAVPLIGTLDTARSQVVMESLLEAIQRHEAAVAIIDITGVPTVDTSVAQHLMQTVKAVRLMGAECIISGIRPAIAQTIVQLGIDLSDTATRANLADALATALRITPSDDGPSETDPAAGGENNGSQEVP
ncbi:STAS domain-containing protein [Streptomyces sp. TR06-5]|uniref:STAS domain-containing protein n=1 Tax=unclassified Streptomyces TaxID=2593676 RepID=UPI0039A119D6